MPLPLPTPNVTFDGQSLDALGVQANFEAIARATANLSPQGIVGLPAGTIIVHGSATPPKGYLLCDGTSYSATQYAKLFDVIGTTYGGSGGSFNVPNLVGGTINSVTLHFHIKL